MKIVSTKLKEIEQQLSTYQVMKTENVINTQPDISIKFDCAAVERKIPDSTDIKINETRQTDPQQLSTEASTLNMLHQPFVMQTYPMNQLRKDDHHQDADDTSSNYDDDDDDDDDNTDSDDGHIDTSYSIDRMASDGENILYTSYYDEGPDRIAYCLLDNDEGDADEYRDWNQSRIVDMISWGSIGKFVCATANGIYTVDHTNRRFKITCVIRGKWSYIRVAANTEQLFVWMNSDENDFDGIEVYSTEFEFIRNINFDTDVIGSFTNETASFCATDNLIASICTRRQNNRQVFQVIFCDLYMTKLYSVPLGVCNGDIEIRTDRNDQFFITTGRRRFYIVASGGGKQIINLRNKGHCIAVFDDQRVAVSDQANGMEIINY
jgi:hypothetical protein